MQLLLPTPDSPTVNPLAETDAVGMTGAGFASQGSANASTSDAVAMPPRMAA